MMNTGIDGSAAMDQDPRMAQSNGYGADGWVNLSPYSQSPYDNSPLAEYAGFSFVPHGLSQEPLQRMPPPVISPQPNQVSPQQQHQQHQQHQQQQQQHHHHHHHHHQLIQPAPSPMGHHQLPMLNTAWPSQLTNPTPTSSTGSYSAAPLTITPVSSCPPPTPVHAPSAATPATPVKSKAGDGGFKPSGQPEKLPRKTLSAEQKRAMCLYHDENPGTRQADIGAKFGVERSTVSKVLRHRDQYLKRDQDPDFALKRAKGKHPDFDRTLSNYVRRQQQRGFEVKDEEILEQAKLFAHASGNQESLLGTLTSSWLQKFKQKHGIGPGRLTRRASETNIPDGTRISTALAAFNKGPGGGGGGGGVSVASPTQPLSPLSGSRSDEDLHKDTLDFEFSYRGPASQSNGSLCGEVRDGSGPFSAGTISPAASFNFSPDPNVGAFSVDHGLLHTGDLGDFQPREKRSNTFPSIDVNFVGQEHHEPVADDAVEPATPRHPAVASASSSAVQSPTAPFAINTALTSPPPPLRRTNSNSSMTGRSAGTPGNNTAVSSTPVDSSPVSPTHEEARQAANTLLSYIQRVSPHGQFEQSEYLAVVQLTKKLQFHQHQGGRPSLGVLSRIPEGDHEVAACADAAAMEVR